MIFKYPLPRHVACWVSLDTLRDRRACLSGLGESRRIMPVKNVLLQSMEQQLGDLKAEVSQLSRGEIKRQECQQDGAWRDCGAAEIHRLNNMISTLEGLAMLLRNPPANLFGRVLARVLSTALRLYPFEVTS